VRTQAYISAGREINSLAAGTLLQIRHAIYYNINIHSPDKPEPNTFYVWPQKTPVLRNISAEGGQNNTEVKNLFL
jgi:hypothetical protein